MGLSLKYLQTYLKETKEIEKQLLSKWLLLSYLQNRRN
nr:MAG TPA: hypothetical protein [Caudoviricetes sp.]